MKKVVITLVALAVCANLLYAQEMKKGMSLANVGVGFVEGVGLNFSYDHGLIDTWGPGIFTIGAFVGFDTWSHTSEIKGAQWAISPRATYRYAISPAFEIYATAMLGVEIFTYSKIKGNNSGVFFGTTAGCRYAFAPSMAVFAEFGYNVSLLNGGISFAF